MARPELLEVDYVRRTRAWPVNLLFLMPWVLVYQLSLMGTRSPVENAAAAWIRTGIRALGPQAFLLVSLLTSLALCLVVLLRLKDAASDRGVFGGMFLEGLAYGAVLGIVAQLLATRLPMERLVPLMAGGGTEGMDSLKTGVRELGLAVGAGIFEELVFRGGLLAALFWVLRRGLGADRVTSAVVAILVAAYVFSDYHHWGVGGGPYQATVFAFRFHAGILLGAIYVTRGLGIAAFAHGFYDVLVVASH